MALIKYKLGDLICQSTEKNASQSCGVGDVRGVSINKVHISTKANMKGVSLKNYLLIKPKYFTYVPVTSRNGEKISICYNDSQDTFICSATYICFYVNRTDILDEKYLFMYFNRTEFDRYSRFNSWGSARETFDWDELCNIEIELPTLEIQKKYVAIYNAMTANQKECEGKLSDLNKACVQIFDKYKRENLEKIKNVLFVNNQKNINLEYGLGELRGINEKCEFMMSRDSIGVAKLHTYNIVNLDQFAMNFMCLGNFGKFYIAYNNERPYIVSPACTIFDYAKNKVLPLYLLFLFSRDEFQRKCVFLGDGNTRGGLSVQEFLSIKIPIPELDIQRDIVNIYMAYLKRAKISNRLDELMSTICPVLVRGASDAT